LGDTADGFYSRRSRPEILAIMKDSRLGTMGLLAIVSCLAIKWAAISVLGANRFLALSIVPAYARGSVLFGLRLLPYARGEGGTGCAFFQTRPSVLAFSGLSLPVVLSLWMGWAAVWVNSAFIIFSAGLVRYYREKLGGVTGDMLGAMIEIMEAGLFLVLATGVAAC
jgi:adenosylcobinamide-GDP ribazoletransferase